MEVKKKRNLLLGHKIIENLRKRHFEAYYCEDAQEAINMVLTLMPQGSSVTWGGSDTIRKMGLTAALHASDYQVFDRDLVQTAEEKQAIYERAFTCDYYLSSANAISEDGVIVNIDGNGNRVAAITWGPKRVIFVIGINKVAQTVEAALTRARSVASPINAHRLNINTPCLKDGACHNCNSPESICSYVHFLRNSRNKGRHVVVLVGEDLGY